MMNQMRVVILGASGMVGGYALRYMLDHPTIERVTAIGRRKLGVSHPIREMVESPRHPESGRADPMASSRLDGEKQ